MTTQLIPASNFQVKRINERYHFKIGSKEGYVIIAGFGIWDIAKGAWVSIGSECPVTGNPVPTRYQRKCTAVACVSGGLYEGYNLIKMNMPQLNECPYYSHFVCGFCFPITFKGKEGIDQHGAEWVNVAENENSIIPEPKNPKYLDAYLDAYNELSKYFK